MTDILNWLIAALLVWTALLIEYAWPGFFYRALKWVRLQKTILHFSYLKWRHRKLFYAYQQYEEEKRLQGLRRKLAVADYLIEQEQNEMVGYSQNPDGRAA